jgi:hypothetical protein
VNKLPSFKSSSVIYEAAKNAYKQFTKYKKDIVIFDATTQTISNKTYPDDNSFYLSSQVIYGVSEKYRAINLIVREIHSNLDEYNLKSFNDKIKAMIQVRK